MCACQATRMRIAQWGRFLLFPPRDVEIYSVNTPNGWPQPVPVPAAECWSRPVSVPECWSGGRMCVESDMHRISCNPLNHFNAASQVDNPIQVSLWLLLQHSQGRDGTGDRLPHYTRGHSGSCRSTRASCRPYKHWHADTGSAHGYTRAMRRGQEEGPGGGARRRGQGPPHPQGHPQLHPQGPGPPNTS